MNLALILIAVVGIVGIIAMVVYMRSPRHGYGDLNPSVQWTRADMDLLFAKLDRVLDLVNIGEEKMDK